MMMIGKIQAVIVVTLIFALYSPALHSAPEHSPEIKEYIEKVRKERRERAEAEAAARKADVHKRLRPYMTLDEVDDYLDDLVWAWPKLLGEGTFGQSVDGRDLRWIRLSAGKEGPGNEDIVEVLVTANIHAQELGGGRVAIGLLEHLVTYYGRDRQVTYVVDNADIYFLPVLNPDVMAETARKQSRWGYSKFRRKNRRQVDLNRNFPYPAEALDKLADGSGSPEADSHTHRGDYPLSEPEALALSEFVDQRNFLLAINYHTAGGWILYPPATFPEPTADTELMEKMAEAYRERQFDKYTAMPSIDLYPTLGALDDYLYHRHGVLSFTVEVGKNMQKRGEKITNKTYSPNFWAYNVFHLDRAIANNTPGAIAMIDYAIKVHQDPGMRKWTPPDELWEGEPEMPGGGQ